MVMTITLVIFSVLFLLSNITNISLDAVKNTVDISVYFKIGLAEKKIFEIRDQLQVNPKVKQVIYVSSKQAFEDFKQKHQNDPLITESLNELTENPLPATLNIKTYDLEDYPEISKSLSDVNLKDFIDKVNYEDNRQIIERLSRILRFIQTFGLVLVLIFCLIAILVIYNTITLTIYNRREEVEIMRLVGATNWYIRGPFVVESLLYGIGSTVLTAFLLLPVFSTAMPKVFAYLYPGLAYGNYFSLTALSSGHILNYWYLVFLLLVISLVLAIVSTLLAIRKYLKI
jgi:cell division transport system permease protein